MENRRLKSKTRVLGLLREVRRISRGPNVRSLCSTFLEKCGQGALRAKPYIELLGPLALVFFAYKADEVSRQQIAIQKMQATMQMFQSRPVFTIDFSEDRSKPDFEDAEITIDNKGGPVYDLDYDVDAALTLIAYRGRDDIPYVSARFLPNYGYAEYSLDTRKVLVSNLNSSPSARIIIPVKWELEEIAKTKLSAQKVLIKGYHLDVQPILLLTIKWRNYSGELSKRFYIVTPYKIMQAEKMPGWGTIGRDANDLRAGFEDTIAAKKYQWTPKM